MQEYPLLDLESAWQEAHHALDDLLRLVDILWVDSQHTWLDMLTIRAQVLSATEALGALPPDVLLGIAKDHADLDEYEAQANR